MKYLVCNLKANKVKKELITYEDSLKNIKTNPNIELIVCPSTPFLFVFQSDNYKLGAQDISMYEMGPHTGENTGEQLASLNVKYALVGHSERRNLFKEEEQTIIQKIKKSYHSHIYPIYFIGEKELDNKLNNTNKVLEQQISHIINEIPDYKREKMIIVYEPIWAIGTGVVPTTQDITDRIIFIKKIIKEYYDLTLPVLYGGSVNENNIIELNSIDKLDGFVLGESSKESDDLIKIYNTIEKNIWFDKNKHNAKRS